MRRTILTPAWFSRIVNPCPYVVDFGHPITKGLIRVDLCNGVIYAYPLYSKTGEVRSLASFVNNGTRFGLGPGGTGLTSSGPSVILGNPANGTLWKGVNAPVLDFTVGTALSYVTTGPSDGLPHAIIDLSQYPTTNVGFTISYAGTQFQFGWYGGTAVTSVLTEAYPGNKTWTFGGTWSGGTQILWQNGLAVGSPTTTGGGQNTTTYQYALGALYRQTGTTGQWSFFNNATTNLQAQIYWVAFWNRVLTDAEMVYINANPMCFLVPAEYEMPVLFSPTVPPSILYGNNIGANFTRKVTTIGY